MTNSEMDIRGYKPADETYYEYRDEEETPRGVRHEKVHDEDIDPSTVGSYASGKDFGHWPFKVGKIDQTGPSGKQGWRPTDSSSEGQSSSALGALIKASHYAQRFDLFMQHCIFSCQLNGQV